MRFARAIRTTCALKLHGSTGSLTWLQEEPNRLCLGKRGEPDQNWSKDPVMLDPAIRRYAALPGGHNEAWPDTFKNIMMNIFEFIASGRDAREANGVDFPTFESGLRTACIAEAIIASGVIFVAIWLYDRSHSGYRIVRLKPSVLAGKSR